MTTRRMKTLRRLLPLLSMLLIIQGLSVRNIPAEDTGELVVYSNILTGGDYAEVVFSGSDPGSGMDLDLGRPREIEVGETLGDFPEITVPEGYRLEKWVDQAGNEVTKDTVVSGDMTVSPVFTEDYPEETDPIADILLPQLALSNDVLSGKDFYAPGDQVSYEIMVMNFGNVDLTNVIVEDSLTGLSETIPFFPTEEVVFYEISYTVTPEDVQNGVIRNAVRVKADDVEVPETEGMESGLIPVEAEATAEVSTVNLDTELQVSKRIINAIPGQPFGLGDVILYEIVVGNLGNVDYENVVVKDELTGFYEKIELLQVGESRHFLTEYMVTSDDILAGTLVNQVYASGDPISGSGGIAISIPEGEDDVAADIDEVDLTLMVSKEVLTKGAVREGDTVDYQIHVSNEGNVPYQNVVVVDELTDFLEVIDVLVPGEARDFVTSYVVTREDVIRGSIYNNAYASGEEVHLSEGFPGGSDGVDKLTNGRVRLRVQYYMDGEQTDSYKGSYEVGSLYRVVSPKIPGYTPDTEVVWGTINEDKTIKVVYTPDRYELTVHYYYLDGTGAAQDFKESFAVGENYRIDSPEIRGFLASMTTVSGQMPARNVETTVFYTGVPAAVPETAVVPAGPVQVPSGNTADGTYQPPAPSADGGTGSVSQPAAASSGDAADNNAGPSDPVGSGPDEDNGIVIDDYEVPLGLGSINLNVGDSIE